MINEALIHHYVFLAGQDRTGPNGVAFMGSACFWKPSREIYTFSYRE